ncbi:MAG: hypothetical protein P4L64_05970 [Caulobacteraceae bacterium]|nr:hypothetical protein [Caulobacteraceae bacterium]
MRLRLILAALIAGSLGTGPGLAQTYPRAPAPPPPIASASAAPAPPALLTAEASHEAVTRWLADNVPSSRSKTVYVSGTEAFWIEHEDHDPKKPMRVVATIHSETFAETGSEDRSVYQVTEYDCEKQTQYQIYLRRYPGSDLSGEARKDKTLLKTAQFVSPVDQDYAHLRTVCLPIYDQNRKRTYSITIPSR